MINARESSEPGRGAVSVNVARLRDRGLLRQNRLCVLPGEALLRAGGSPAAMRKHLGSANRKAVPMQAMQEEGLSDRPPGKPSIERARRYERATAHGDQDYSQADLEGRENLARSSRLSRCLRLASGAFMLISGRPLRE